MLNCLFSEIRTFPKVYARYDYAGEGGINPAYTDIERCEPLCPGEKRIWVLRGDGTLATGIKNVCVREGNTDLFQKVEGAFHKYLDKTNRYGHPSLALPEETYDGSVHYAGWLCNRDQIEVFLQSGRFHNEMLTDEQRNTIEAHVAEKFIKAYGKESVVFYDRNDNEMLTNFLAGPFPPDRPCRVYTKDSIKKFAYERLMAIACRNMQISVMRLGLEDRVKKSDLLKTWIAIKGCFDAVIYNQMDRNKPSQLKEALKESLRFLVEKGIPFVDGRNLVIWSTKFARNEANKYAAESGGVTDGMAQESLRKIVVGWPDGRLDVLFPIVKDQAPAFPELAKVFWAAMSEMFMEEIQEERDIHLFFQDALTIGNFCWENELPIARSKGAQIHLHRYNPHLKRWKPSIDLDSSEADHIPIKRRAIHPLDTPESSHMEIKDGYSLWKQEFKGGRLEGELVAWHSPAILTIGKLRSIAKIWKSSICCKKNDSSVSFFL